MSITTLLKESTSVNAISSGRPTLVSLTRATTNLIYTNIVATQHTLTPNVTIYGIKYQQADGTLSATSAATTGGLYTVAEREALPKYPTVLSFGALEDFTVGNVVYRALEDLTLVDGVYTIEEALFTNKIRIVADSADDNELEAPEEAKFTIDTWASNVKTRKLKTEFTVELAQDLEANNFDAPALINDILATQMAEEVNKHIIQSLITVSSRYNVQGVTKNGMIDFTNAEPTTYGLGRVLYQYVCDMNSKIQTETSFSGTYVVASARCAALLAASGFMVNDADTEYLADSATGLLNNGLELYTDVNAPFDYVLVGLVEEFGDMETVGSLFYCPYSEGLDPDNNRDHIGAFKVCVDPNSLQPKVMLLMRYALSANPYTSGDDVTRVHDAGNLDTLSGKSKMSVVLGVKLPKYA